MTLCRKCAALLTTHPPGSTGALTEGAPVTLSLARRAQNHMGKFVKFPSGPEIVGIVVIMVAFNYVWGHFVPTNVKSALS